MWGARAAEGRLKGVTDEKKKGFINLLSGLILIHRDVNDPHSFNQRLKFDLGEV